jgi:hypothetical protein
VLVSNLGLTVFVKHQVNWLNRFCSLPSGGEKQLKDKNCRSPFFAPYWSKSLQMLSLSLSFYRKHICLTGYIGEQKSTSSRVPIHAFTGVLLLAMQALLVTLIELFFNYKHSAGGRELGLPGSRANRQIKIDERSSQGVGATEISICKPSTTLPTSDSGRSKGERDALSH